LRGYNLSSKPSEVEQYSIHHLVEDLRALEHYLGVEKMILVGHDWGGAIAWVLTALHPHLVEKLVIINAPHPAIMQRELRQNPQQQEASQYMLIFRTSQAESILSANDYQMMVDNVLAEGMALGVCSEEEKQTYLDAWSQPGALSGGLNYYRASRIGPPLNEQDLNSGYLAEDFSHFRIHAPTLVIWGEQDPYLLSSNLIGLEQYVPDLTIKRIPDGSHWVVHEKPDVVNATIREFIAR
jgi:epoxide hydrolase 4